MLQHKEICSFYKIIQLFGPLLFDFQYVSRTFWQLEPKLLC